MSSKRELRQEALRERRSLDHKEVEGLSQRASRIVLSLPEYLRAETIASYVAKPDEVQTRGIIEAAYAQGKRVLVPKSHPQSSTLTFHAIESFADLAPGPFGVLEPSGASASVPLARSQVVLVPVVAWDDRGERLGYGKGFFDRELASRGKAVAVGLAFEFQRRRNLPATANDVNLDIIVTEERAIRFGRQGIGR